MIRFSHKTRGYFLVQTIVFASIAVVILSGLVSFATANMKLGRRSALSEQAFQMAEAGLEYYRWHLAHNPTDYTNGTGQAGPYIKNFTNKNGVVIGTITLTITPPPAGSTLVTIESKGTVAIDTAVTRTILAKLAVPSFANYANISNTAMRFGEGTEVYGPIHSNGGLRFDGIAHNLVTSAVSSYDDADHTGGVEFGVHTHVNVPPATGVNDTFRSLEAPNSAVQTRSDVFTAGRSFPAPSISFTAITSNLTQIKTDAQASGRYFAASGVQGYKIVLKTNDTFDIYKVNTLTAAPNQCTNTASQTGWGTWSVNTTTLVGNYTFPTNGLIYVEDHAWVEGTINGARITIVAARLPDSASNRKSITINNDIKYTNFDGTDVIALIGQNDVNVGLVSEDDLEIDAALVAQNGRVGRYFYETDCAPYDARDSLTLYGTIVTALRYGFAYVGGLGYADRILTYDSYLLYNPPPSFPKTAAYHKIIFWKELE